MSDFRDMRLGLIHQPVPASPHLTGVLAPLAVPDAVDWFDAVRQASSVTICNGKVRANDRRSCCVAVGALQYLRTIRAVYGDERDFTDDQVLDLYAAWGWDGTDAGDIGLNSVQAGILWSARGIQWCRQLEDVPNVLPIPLAHLRAALAFLGPCQLDLALPLAWQTAKTWDVVDGPDGKAGSWGAHRICVGAYDAEAVTAVTWGVAQSITWDAVAEYGLGAWACVDRRWLETTSLSPAGLDYDRLAAEGAALA
jgi:hypothetical protein